MDAEWQRGGHLRPNRGALRFLHVLRYGLPDAVFAIHAAGKTLPTRAVFTAHTVSLGSDGVNRDRCRYRSSFRGPARYRSGGGYR